MDSNEIRKKFLDFFSAGGAVPTGRQGPAFGGKEYRHAVVASSSLVPDDPSVLLTTAGMQQFKPYYVGKATSTPSTSSGQADPLRDFGSKNVASIQKCFRTSDIDEVGDKTHLTFFEMLGNFSFGGYFKKEAIHWAYEFVVNELGINRDRITVSVFGGDKGNPSAGSGQTIPLDRESFDIWHKELGFPKDKIIESGRADNFWGPTGNEGPCGPTTEIYVDGMEIWNLVFNEYYCTRSQTDADESGPGGQKSQRSPQKSAKSALTKLETPGVDTGMGLERLAVMLQGVDNVFETDLFHPIISKIQEVKSGLEDRVLRVLTDHLRASAFLIADGVRPSNKEAGYILRRLLRRILVYGIKYDIHADVFSLAVPVIKELYGDWYPEVKNTKEILAVMLGEKTKFEKALTLGVKEIEKYETISAKDAFYIYETFGLPFELLQELAPAKVSAIGGKDQYKTDLDAELKKHQEISRAGLEKKFGGHGLILDTGELKAATPGEVEIVTRLHTATHLLQAALRQVLGTEVKQMGSDITAERTRFDFSFSRRLTDEEVKKVEDLVNEAIQKDLPVSYQELPIAEAKKTNALYFFREKYPDRVKVYSMGDFSKEFCGGPHVTNTLKIGKFKISKQEAVGAGVRRIRGVVV